MITLIRPKKDKENTTKEKVDKFHNDLNILAEIIAGQINSRLTVLENGLIDEKIMLF